MESQFSVPSLKFEPGSVTLPTAAVKYCVVPFRSGIFKLSHLQSIEACIGLLLPGGHLDRRGERRELLSRYKEAKCTLCEFAPVGGKKSQVNIFGNGLIWLLTAVVVILCQ